MNKNLRKKNIIGRDLLEQKSQEVEKHRMSTKINHRLYKKKTYIEKNIGKQYKQRKKR